MRMHFEREARLMQEAGGAMCACHRHEHQTLLELCDQSSAVGRSNKSAVLAANNASPVGSPSHRFDGFIHGYVYQHAE
jgi:hypothetical protein